MTFDPEHLAEVVRAEVVKSAMTAYEHAAMQGLCSEGAWEVAITAMRRLDLRQFTLQHGPHGSTP
jgi:hypothetical protein